MTRDQALSKIRKCLALAKSSNPHEAAAGMRQAQKLMAEHNLSELDSTMTEVSESTVAAVMMTVTTWESTLSNMVADAFGCDVFWRKSTELSSQLNYVRKRTYIFVGIGAAADVASYAYEVLSRQCAKARLAHIAKQSKKCKPITKTARGDQFALGWAYGVQALLDKFANSDSNQALLESYMEQKHPGLQKVKAKNRAVGRNVKDDDIYLGVQSGKQAQLQRGVGGIGMSTAPAKRNNDLAAIHIAQKALCLSKDDADALKRAVTGKDSSADMTVPERRRYLAHLSGLQAQAAGKPKPIYTGQRRELERSANDGQDGRWRKARALWALLAQAGVVKVNTDAALTKYVHRQTKVEAWRFLNGYQINTVIESLKTWCTRSNVEFEK